MLEVEARGGAEERAEFIVPYLSKLTSTKKLVRKAGNFHLT